MESFTFKNLSDIETVEQPSNEARLIAIQNGTLVQAPIKKRSLSTDDRVFVVDTTSYDWADNRQDPNYGDKVKEALLRGDMVWVYEQNSRGTFYYLVYGFELSIISNGNTMLRLRYANGYCEVFYHGE